MKFKSIKSAIQASLIFPILVLISGCAKYEAQPLNRIILDRNATYTKQGHISLDYHVFNRSDCKRYLDRDIIAKGYQPIQIALTNKTNRYLHISMSNFSIPVVTPEEIAEQFHTSTVGRATGYGAAAAFICLPLAIPAIVDGVKSSKANKRLDIDYSNKSLRNCTMNPQTTLNGLVFVPTNAFTGDFSIRVIDHSNNEEFVLSTTKPYVAIA